SLGAVLPALPHALDLLAGDTAHRPEGAVSDAGGHRHAGHEGRQAAGSIEDDLAARRASGQAVVMATAVRVEGNPPCRVGQKILLGPSGALAGTLGCAEFDQSAVADAPEFIRSGAPGTRTYTHELGSVEVYLEPFARRPLLVVFSATPVAEKLLRWGKDVGFDPVLVESRAERVTPEHRASAPVRPSLDGLAIDAETAAVHTDHDA